jgi:hypothetical protein
MMVGVLNLFQKYAKKLNFRHLGKYFCIFLKPISFIGFIEFISFIFKTYLTKGIICFS